MKRRDVNVSSGALGGASSSGAGLRDSAFERGRRREKGKT